MEIKRLSSLTSVKMVLSDLLYVSYLVPTNRIRPLVPDILPLASVDGSNVFLSLVIFRGKVVRASLLPTPRLTFDQVNVRTYVLDPESGHYGVYFINCAIGSALITFLYRIMSGMPVEHITLKLHNQRDHRMRYVNYSVSGYWHGDFVIEAEEAESQAEHISPFSSKEGAIKYLIDPLIGFYGPRNHVRRIEVWHPHSPPRLARVLSSRCEYLTALGLVEEKEIRQPQNVLLVSGWPFLTFLPPQYI